MNKKIKECNNGDNNGGTFGFLRSLRRLIVDHRATKVIVCWEGKRSTHRRKKIFSEYKANRSIPKRVVRAYDFEETPQKQLKDLKAQLQAVQQYLHLLPVYQLQVEYTEADDIIAYLASYRFPEIEKIIVSNDKDFLQLISDNVSVYRPATKKIMSTHELLEKTGIHPNNWLIVKTIEGDKSDCIPGIRGVGPKSILKYFPEVAEPDEITTEKLFTICEEQSNINKTVSYKKIIAGKEIIERNYKLMQLTNIDLSQNVNLTHLSISQNTSLTDLDLSSNSQLIYFSYDSKFKFFSTKNFVESIFVSLCIHALPKAFMSKCC